jgi:4-amino-4-deoxy-L-arabinose transferase-like glycosyltransferase
MSGYPLLTELLYAVPVTHRLPFAARILHVAFGAGVVFAIYGFLRNRLSAAGALAFGAAFLVFEPVNEVAVWANTDVARTFFLVVAAAFLARYLERRECRNLVVGSIAAGLALSTHYMCLVFGNVAFSAAFVATALAGREKWSRMARDLAIFWVISIIIMSPWLLKNLYYHGWWLQGVQNTSFRIPPISVLTGFYLGNGYFLGFGAVALWLLARRNSPADVRFLSLYLLLYLALGVFFIPSIMRFFYPVYAVGLTLAGRLAAPALREKPWLEIAIALALLAMIAVVTAIYVWNGVYGDAVTFLFEGNPPYESVRWNAFP